MEQRYTTHSTFKIERIYPDTEILKLVSQIKNDYGQVNKRAS
ncbi:hypothetical protein [Paenibacillus sp. Soil787]|nr:hypothetical protein [Paenibacillus sp. Soil787]